MKAEGTKATESPNRLTKYGGFHIMAAYVPMCYGSPIKMDGSDYNDDSDEMYDQDETPRKIYVADKTVVENFIKACRCDKTDFDDWMHAVNRDMGLNDYDRHHVEDFFKTVKLHDEPVVNQTLCQELQKGTIAIVMEVTDYLFVVHVGNDFTSVLKSKLLECRDSGDCTFTVTGQAFCAQRASRCRTCFGDDVSMAICDNCIATCHRGHDTYIIVKPNPHNDKKSQWTVPKILMYCDCGHKLPCELL